jgi:hypothetical protein
MSARYTCISLHLEFCLKPREFDTNRGVGRKREHQVAEAKVDVTREPLLKGAASLEDLDRNPWNPLKLRPRNHEWEGVMALFVHLKREVLDWDDTDVFVR